MKRKRIEEEEEEEEEEDDDGYLLSLQLDHQIQSGLYALRNNDPLIYDREHSFIKLNNNKRRKINENTKENTKKNTKEYKWVKQLNDPEKDKFLKEFFSNQLWKCCDDTILSTIDVHRGYKGRQHLDDIDLNNDDQDIDKQNDFERNWQKKQSQKYEKELKQQLLKKQCIDSVDSVDCVDDDIDNDVFEFLKE